LPPATVNTFKGVYTRSADLILMNQGPMLAAQGVALLDILTLIAFRFFQHIRRRRRKKTAHSGTCMSVNRPGIGSDPAKQIPRIEEL
jgi:hypothetical protein